MKTAPLSVSVRPLTDVRGSIYRTGYMSNDTENNENRAAARQQAARPCLRVGLRLYFHIRSHACGTTKNENGEEEVL